MCFTLVKIKNKCLEFSEAKDYAKILCEVFPRVLVKTGRNFHNILYLLFFRNHPFHTFLVSKHMYIFIKKNGIKLLCLTLGGGGQGALADALRQPLIQCDFY